MIARLHGMSNHELATLFFLQLAVILAVCRVVGWVAQRFGQPQVVGEMIAGVLLGPSLLGLVAPGVGAALFPRDGMPVLYTVAQVGLSLYMFTVGLEFRLDLVSARARSAAAISLAGIVTPFCLGVAAVAALHPGQGLFAPTVSLGEAALYMGAAMSITAFPMLARIIYERGLTGTTVGTLALAAGAIDDVMAWCLLAIVLASVGGNWSPALLALGGGACYALVVLWGLRPLLTRTLRAGPGGELGPTTFGVVLLLLALGAWFTDRIGIYAVFGAFIMGVAVPKGPVAVALGRLVAPLTTALFLPLFFVYSGLNTQIGLLSTGEAWLIAMLVLLLACLGKGVACWLAARATGQPAREAMQIGALMNARGLMELIILNIGLERGVITPTLFSVMVFMAIVTTLMATPLFNLFSRAGSLPTQVTPAPV